MECSPVTTENDRVQKKRCLDYVPSTQASSGTVTLPSIFAPLHLEDFQVFKDRANKAFDGAFPKTSRPRYTKVKVLLLNWEDDDLGVDSELKNLGAVFERAFRFETESWGIPSLGSEEALTNHVFKFRSCAAPDQLLIVYYGGHADRLPHNHCIWRCRRDESSPTLDWSLIQPFLLASSSDTLVLLDCCFAARGGKDITPCQTTNEVIAACSPESPATGVERRSFTSAVTRELELLAHKHETQGTCFTAVSLHSALFRYDRELRYAPFYVRLTDHECMSIDITPLPRTPGLHCAVEMMGSVPELPQEITRVPEPGARILLAINTTRSPGGDLVAFLRSEGILPEYVSSMEVVKVEAVYRSRSTLTLVSLPMEVWHLLPKDPACFPVGIVTSDNLLPSDLTSHERPSNPIRGSNAEYSTTSGDEEDKPILGLESLITASAFTGISSPRHEILKLELDKLSLDENQSSHNRRKETPGHSSEPISSNKAPELPTPRVDTQSQHTKIKPLKAMPLKAKLWQCHLCFDEFMSIQLHPACLTCGHQPKGCPYCKLQVA